jgi:predicted regulator of amino acid metabolism with ACT domain
MLCLFVRMCTDARSLLRSVTLSRGITMKLAGIITVCLMLAGFGLLEIGAHYMAEQIAGAMDNSANLIARARVTIRQCHANNREARQDNLGEFRFSRI